jgi:ribonuclease HII
MIGIDEVGRGAWAGPLLVVAARQNSDFTTVLSDSKKLSKKQRETLFETLQQFCSFGEGWVSPKEVDELGLTGAMKLGVKRALEALMATSDEAIIMDGHINYCAPEYLNVVCEVKADANHAVVSAASIYAKVTRDRVMTNLAKDYLGYGFESNVGYGTAKHVDGIKQHGITKHHRKSYKPVRELANG